MPFTAREELVIRRPMWHEEDMDLICGVANAGGGRIVITLAERDSARKMRRLRKTFESIPRMAMQDLGIECSTEPVMDGAQLCLEIAVPSAPHPLHYLGTYYLYTNGQNTVIDQGLLEQFFDGSETSSWETAVQPFARKDDLDETMLDQLAQALKDHAKAEQGLDADALDLSKVLEAYGIKDARTGALTNTGVLLLHRDPQTYLPGAFVRIGLFDEDGTEIGQPRTVRGPLTKQHQKTLALLYDFYLPRALELQQGAVEQMDKLPPREAVGEALINALVHKDYESALPIKISVYPYRLHMDNVGRPPENWTEADLMGRHNSRPTNPTLANALSLREIFNGWGNGITSMIRACQQAGVPLPKITLRSDETEVSFAIGIDAQEAAGSAGMIRSSRPFLTPDDEDDQPRTSTAAFRDTNSPSALGRFADDSPNTADSAASFEGRSDTRANYANGDRRTDERSNTAIPESPSKKTFKDHSVAAANRLDMTSTDEYVFKVLETNGRVTATRIAEVLGVSESTVRRSFRRLRELGFIERIGSNKAGYWRVLDR